LYRRFGEKKIAATRWEKQLPDERREGRGNSPESVDHIEGSHGVIDNNATTQSHGGTFQLLVHPFLSRS
jgi:hypothetical protein